MPSYNDSEPDGGLSDSDVEELQNEDFPQYFEERDGRLYSSHPTSPYPLPIDAPEQERMNVQHNALYRLIGNHYVGPVHEVLREDGRQKMALDICTGTGKWAMDMAAEFPHVNFRAFDTVPISTRYPLENVQFEIHDVNVQTRWPDNTMHLVHARSISMAVRDYRTVIREAHRLLVRGGLFISCEWGRYPSFHPSFRVADMIQVIPAVCEFYRRLSVALEQLRGVRPIASVVAPLLSSSGLFTNITPQEYYMPIGQWHGDPRMQTLGKAFRKAIRRYSESVRPLLLQSGNAPHDLDALYDQMRIELSRQRGMISVYHTVYATKR